MEYWLSYAALTAFWLALPNRGSFLVATYAQGKGRITALSSLPAFLLAHMAAALVAAHLTYVAAFLSPAILAGIKWLGGLLLFMAILAMAIIPDLTGPFADNDNLRRKHAPGAFLDVFAETFFERRTLFFYLGVVPHFLQPAAAWDLQLEWLLGATILPALLVVLFPALFAQRFMDRLHRRKALRRKVKRGGMVSLASSAVTAGYRKIAA